MNLSISQPAARPRQATVYLTLRPSGLGNQLFQYSAAFCLARRSGIPLVLDSSRFECPRPPNGSQARQYGLENFQISARRAYENELEYFHRRDFLARLRRFGDFMRSRGQRALIMETHDYDRCPHPGITGTRIRRMVMMNGFWECAIYPQTVETELRRELQFKNPPPTPSADWIARIGSGESVAVHVRGGDLLEGGVPATRRYLPGPDFFAKAAEIVASAVSKPVFYIFSDDPVRAREVLRLPYPCQFVQLADPAKPHDDLRLMTQCRHHILCPSTFGWWGAWLGKKPGQIVVATRKFYLQDIPSTEYYYPPEWIRI